MNNVYDGKIYFTISPGYTWFTNQYYGLTINTAGI